MGAQDNTERVLRSLHILLSRSEVYPKEPSKVIIDRDQMVRLLNDLTQCIYDMMAEYEMTLESRTQAEREFQKQGDEIVLKASHRAEDVYAASVMYTDEALNSIQDIMDNTSETMRVLFEEMERRMKEEKQNLRSNQLELRSQLQDLADTEKYMKIIEDRNREIQKEKAAQEDRQYAAEEKNIYADRQTGIKINEEYFAMMGIPLEDDLDQEPMPEENVLEDQIEEPVKKKWGGFWKNAPERETFPEVQDLALDDEIADLGIVLDNPAASEPDPELARRAAEAQIRVDLDADYFKWKEQQETDFQAQNTFVPQPEAPIIPEPEPTVQPELDIQDVESNEEYSYLENDPYSEATKEAERELSEGIHAIWKSMTESFNEDSGDEES